MSSKFNVLYQGQAEEVIEQLDSVQTQAELRAALSNAWRHIQLLERQVELLGRRLHLVEGNKT
jgi:hypothetical protein